MKLIIYTSFDCLLKSDEWEETLDKNQHLTLDEKPKSLAIYPIGKNTRPSFEVDFNSPSSTFYRIIEKDDKILLFILDGITAQNVKVYSLNCEGKKCQVEVGKSEVSFLCKDNKKIVNLPYSVNSSQCGHFYHIAYAKLNSDNLQYLIAYNTKTYQSKVFKGEYIHLTENGFIVSSQAHGYRAIKEQIVVSKDGLKIKNRDFVTSQSHSPEQTLTYQFLNAVKLSDFTSALNLLSSDLALNLSPTSLKDFFGNLSYIFPIDENTCFAISNNQNKIYSFTVKNGKITDIDD